MRKAKPDISEEKLGNRKKQRRERGGAKTEPIQG